MKHLLQALMRGNPRPWEIKGLGKLNIRTGAFFEDELGK
jgi:hypothetical protein